MKKLVYLLLPIFVWSYDLPYFMSDKHGYIPNNKFDMGLYNTKMNDALDILSIKDSEVDSTQSNASLGDLDGYSAFLRYKINKKTLFIAKYSQQNLNYGYGELQNRHFEAFFRRNFVSRVFALDIGIMQNESKPLVAENLSPSNSIISEAIGNSDIKVIKNTQDVFGSYTCDSAYSHCISWERDDGTTLLEGTNSTNLSEVAADKEINFVATIEDLSDRTVFIRAVRSFTDMVSSNDFYVELRKTDIKSSVVGSATYLNETISTIKKLDSDEKTVVLGWNYSTFVKPWAMDLGYEFNYIFRDDDFGGSNTNHKIHFNLGYNIFDNLQLFVGAKVMSNQFNADIPYLYNEYTKNSFDKKYGYFQTGLVFKF